MSSIAGSSIAGNSTAGAGGARRGLTLVELVLALGLFALLSVGVVQLLDGALGVIDDAGEQRELMAAEGAALGWLGRDFKALAAGDGADLLAGWTRVDVDGDRIAGRSVPLLRLVRRAAPQDLARLGGLIELRDAGGDEQAARRIVPLAGRAPRVEVLYALLPSDNSPLAEGQPGRRGDLDLVRAERLAELEGESYFALPMAQLPGLLDRWVREGRADVLARGVLALDVQFAAAATSLAAGWNPGTQLGDSLRQWDARGLGRVDPELSPWNAPSMALPATPGSPVLPRRVRLEFVIESERSHLRRPRIAEAAPADAERLRFERAERLPRPGALLLVGEEWVELLGAPDGDGFATVGRARRGTRRVPLRAGTPVQWGQPAVREILLPAAREEYRQ